MCMPSSPVAHLIQFFVFSYITLTRLSQCPGLSDLALIYNVDKCSGSVVESKTWDRRVTCSRLTRGTFPLLNTGSTQEMS